MSVETTSTPGAGWTGHALRALEEAGYRAGGARRRVVELLGRERCTLTALQIDARLDGVGRATVYRTLEQLAELRLVQRLDIGGEAAAFERVDPDGHHHHMVCERCGRVAPFSDPKLERAIEAVSREAEFAISGHEVVLRGICPRCGG